MKKGFITALKLAKAKSSKGFRYEADWLLHCLLIRIKSPQMYCHLRELKMLPLPHPDTLQKLIRAVPCSFGIQDSILEALQPELSKKCERDRQCVLLFDEIKLREGLEFSKSDLRVKGYIDYAEFTDEFHKHGKQSSNALADHALVLMVRSLNSKWVSLKITISQFLSIGTNLVCFFAGSACWRICH